MSETNAQGEAGVRASDGERGAAVEALHRALGDGRLTLEETEERVTTAYAARFRAELPPLLADLPAAADPTAPPAGSAPTWVEIRHALVWRARLCVLGADAAAPTARQCRAATLAAIAAVVWVLVCALAGALVVAA